MTIRAGFIKTVLFSLLAVMTTLPVRSQATGGIEFNTDSVRSARMDSIYRTLNDTTSWERELEFVRSLQFVEPRDSDLLEQMAQQEMPAAERPKRMTWKQKERQAVEEINLNSSTWEPEPRLAVWFSLLFPGGGQIYNRKLEATHSIWRIRRMYLRSHLEPVHLHRLSERLCGYHGR